jgi:transposase
MTDQETNVAIAEACGWKSHEDWWEHPSGGMWAKHNELRRIPDSEILPHYCQDLNAMCDAAMWLKANRPLDYDTYHRQLDRRVALGNSEEHGIYTADATARQRAQAFLRTIGKWRGE